MNDQDVGTRLAADGVLEGLSIPPSARLQQLTGHASARRFFRVTAGAVSTVLVAYPVDDPSGPRRYVDTAAFLRRAGVLVPTVHAVGARALVVQDGGDELLDCVPPGRQPRLYRQAARIMLRLQRQGRREVPPNPDLSLDATRLRQELDFAEQHALAGWLGIDDGRDGRERFYDRLVSEIERLPQALCHRDYHARNLLMVGDRLMVLDFQDIMQGPLFYDLASLVWDNYCDLEASVATETVASFWSGSRCRLEASAAAEIPDRPAGLPPVARQAFCLVGLQRCLKALGTFAYQVTVAGNADYARYAPRTWRHARAALVALGWGEDLRRLEAFERVPA